MFTELILKPVFERSSEPELEREAARKGVKSEKKKNAFADGKFYVYVFEHLID